MVEPVEHSYKLFRKRLLRSLKRAVNGLGNRHQCYVCKKNFWAFRPYRKGSASVPPFVKELDVIGSDVDNFECMFCLSSDRERHLFMFFDKLQLWNEFRESRILHIAPERNLREEIGNMNPVEYVLGDILPQEEEVRKIDSTNIDYPEDYFDVVICNHVLEHIQEDGKAMSEIFRVLKAGGKAVLQTPFSRILKNSFEDPNINTNELRQRFYGEPVHYRIYGWDLFDKFKSVGFTPKTFRSDDYISRNECRYYGVNPREDLIMVLKG